MRLWLDDLRPAPEGYVWVKTVYDAIEQICRHNADFDYCWKVYVCGCCTRERLEHCLAYWRIDEVSCDNDLGEHEPEGYKLLDWLEATGRNYPIHIHTDNAVARERMRAIVERNGWTEVR